MIVYVIEIFEPIDTARHTSNLCSLSIFIDHRVNRSSGPIKGPYASPSVKRMISTGANISVRIMDVWRISKVTNMRWWLGQQYWCGLITPAHTFLHTFWSYKKLRILKKACIRCLVDSLLLGYIIFSVVPLYSYPCLLHFCQHHTPWTSSRKSHHSFLQFLNPDVMDLPIPPCIIYPKNKGTDAGTCYNITPLFI